LFSLAVVIVLYDQHFEIKKLSKDLEIAKINSEFHSIIKIGKHERSYEFGCVIYIEKHTGKFEKWHISVNGLQHVIGDTTVKLSHRDSDGIIKSWFPSRSDESDSGAGNSVSSAEEYYTFELVSKVKSGRVVSLFSRLMDVCE